MAGFSNDTENKLLNHLFNGTSVSYAGGTKYIALHTGDPGETGANEVSTSLTGYARKSHSSFTTASSGTLSNSGDITFATITHSSNSATVTHVGIWDSASGGNFISGGAVGRSKTISLNDIPKILDGELDIALD